MDTTANSRNEAIDGGIFHRLGGYILVFLSLFIFSFLVWIVAYGIGLAPWFGIKSMDHTYNGLSHKKSDSDFGIENIWLFRGQTAFIKYTINDLTKSRISISISYLGEDKDNMTKNVDISEAKRGILNFKVKKSGFHQYRIVSSEGKPARGEKFKLRYSINWGAYFFGAPDTISVGQIDHQNSIGDANDTLETRTKAITQQKSLLNAVLLRSSL